MKTIWRSFILVAALLLAFHTQAFAFAIEGPAIKTFGLLQGTDAEPYDVGSAHALFFTPDISHTIGQAAFVPLAAGSVRVALYSRVPPAAYSLRWQSSAIDVQAGVEVAVPIASNPLVVARINEQCLLLLQASGPGILGGSQVNYDPLTTGFNVAIPGGTFPATIDPAAPTTRFGAVAAQVTIEGGVSFYTLEIVPTVGGQGYSGSRTVKLALWGTMNSVEVAENPAFDNLVSFTNPASRTGPYTFLAEGEGTRTLYARARGRWSVSETIARSIVIDLTPPTVPSTPTDGGIEATSTTVTFRWDPSTETGTASPIDGYEREILIQPQGQVLVGFTKDLFTTAVVPYGRVTCRVRAFNLAGLASDWSPPSDGINVYANQLPRFDAVETSYQVVNTDSVWFKHTGRSDNPAFAQMSEDPAFPPPVQETLYGGWIKYDLSDTSDGLHTINHRLRLWSTPETVTAVRTTQVFVDRVAPVPVPPVPLATFGADATMDILWRTPSDPAPSSGIVPEMYSNMKLVRDDGSPAPFFKWLPGGGELPTTRTVVLEPGNKGGMFRAATTATDQAGNKSDWVYSEPFELNARPFYPSITLDPMEPTSDQFLRIVASATDPDGDALVEYRYRFWRDNTPEYAFAGDTLAPGIGKKDEVWRAAALAVDSRGAIGWEGVYTFRMGNGRPSQPVVRIKPRTPEPGRSLIVDVLVYSTDPDGDEIGYDFRWKKSVDGGATWIPKLELNGSSQVDGAYIEAGELWAVEYIPYEIPTTKSAKAARIEGKAARDVVRIGTDNTPPLVDAARPLSSPGAAPGTTRVRAAWTASDREGGPITMEIFLTDLKYLGQQQVAAPFDARLGLRDLEIALPPGGPYYLQLVATDNKGAVTQVITPAIAETAETAEGWMLE